jgi:hypothetical protein
VARRGTGDTERAALCPERRAPPAWPELRPMRGDQAWAERR